MESVESDFGCFEIVKALKETEESTDSNQWPGLIPSHIPLHL